MDQIASIELTRVIVDGLKPENLFAVFTHCDQLSPEDALNKGTLMKSYVESIKDYGEIVLKEENCLEFGKESLDLEQEIGSKFEEIVPIKFVDDIKSKGDEYCEGIFKHVKKRTDSDADFTKFFGKIIDKMSEDNKAFLDKLASINTQAPQPIIIQGPPAQSNPGCNVY